jgi:hypothetical protein
VRTLIRLGERVGTLLVEDWVLRLDALGDWRKEFDLELMEGGRMASEEEEEEAERLKTEEDWGERGSLNMDMGWESARLKDGRGPSGV